MMGHTLMKQLTGHRNLLVRISIAIAKCYFVMVMLTMHLDVSAQDTLGKWTFSVAPSFYLSPKVTLNSGEYPMRFLPSSGWNLDLRRSIYITTRKEVNVYYTWGGTTYITNTIYNHGEYPIVLQAGRRHWITHRYHAFGISTIYQTYSAYRISIGIANRFYPSGSNRYRSHARQTGTHNEILVYDGYTSSSSWFCPELMVLFSHSLFKKNSAWRYEIKVSIAPLRIIQGEYLVLPDEPDFKSEGEILVRQSYLSFGISYRRIKKDF